MRGIYTPDRWVMAVVTPEIGQPFRCIFGGWVGGYLGSDNWRRSTQIVSRVDNGEFWDFKCASGSTYRCHKKGYGVTVLVASIIDASNQEYSNGFKGINVLTEEEAMTQKTYVLRIPESLFNRLTADAKIADSFPDVDSVDTEEYCEWYENRTSASGNFDDCYNNGVRDGEALLSRELLGYLVEE